MDGLGSGLIALAFFVGLILVVGFAVQGFGRDKSESQLRSHSDAYEVRARKAEQRVKELEEELRTSENRPTIEGERQAAKEYHERKLAARDEALRESQKRVVRSPQTSVISKRTYPGTASGQLVIDGVSEPVAVHAGRQDRRLGDGVIEALDQETAEVKAQILIGFKGIERITRALDRPPPPQSGLTIVDESPV